MVEKFERASQNLNSPIAEHWNIDEEMVETTLSALRSVGMSDPALPQGEKFGRMAKLDHFHGGGIETTEILRRMMHIPEKEGLHGLDIGSGIGGPLRWFALKTHAQMDGLDITPSFVRIAQNVNAEVGMKEQCFCAVGDATRIPSDAHYDFATMMAVSCNIRDRDALYRSVHESLKPGGVVGMLDIVKGDTDGLVLPVPWSRDGKEDTSLLLDSSTTIERVRVAGFTFESKQDVSSEVLAWFENESKELTNGRGLGFENIIPDWAQMVASQVQNLQQDKIAFICFVFSKPKIAES